MIRHLEDGLAQALMKGVASCDKPRVGACILRSEDARIGYPLTACLVYAAGTPARVGKPAGRKHPSRRRKRNQPRFPELSAREKGIAQTEPPVERQVGCGVADQTSSLPAKPKWPGKAHGKG